MVDRTLHQTHSAPLLLIILVFLLRRCLQLDIFSIPAMSSEAKGVFLGTQKPKSAQTNSRLLVNRISSGLVEEFPYQLGRP